MLQREVEVTSLTPLTLPVLFILYKRKPMVKKDPLVLSICCIFPKQETKDQSMKRHHCNMY